MAKINNVTRAKIADLTPYEKNARVHTDGQINQIAASIKEFGFLNPILIDKDGNIIAGHGRVMAAERLGMEDVPALYVEGLTDAQRRAYILADNRLTELGGWNMELVKVELEELDAGGFDVSLTGFDLDIEDPVEPEDDDYQERDVAPRSKYGDIYKLGTHRLMCGDSTAEDQVALLMNKEYADMVFTDPPWNVSYGQENGCWKQRSILNDSMSTEDFKEFMFKAFSAMNKSSKAGCMTYVVMSAQEWGNLMLVLKQKGYHWSSTIIWCKDQLVLSRKDYHTQYEPIWYGWKDGDSRLCPLKDRKQSDVWNFERPKRSDEHPTMKPVPLVAQAIINSSKKGDLVLDLFGGSGTTLIAAEETDRRCYMMELDPHYVDVIIDRWETFTGEKAVLING